MEAIKENSVEVTMDQHTYTYQKTAEQWTLILRKSEIQVSEEKDLALLKVTHPLLLATEILWEEDRVTFCYALPKERITFAALKEASKEDKLRAMANLAEVAQLLEGSLTFFMHPENLLFDYNLLPKIAYRGLSGKMLPKTTDEAVLLRQYKSLIIALFEKKQDFTALYDGQLEIKKGSEFVQTILSQESFEEIRAYLLQTYAATVAQTQETMQQISKTKLRVTKQLSIWMSVLAAILVVPLVYLLFFRLPFLDRMQQTDTAFLKNDYEAVITTLEAVDTARIPFTQKYELAYSFVQGEALQEQQKKVILNNVTLRSNENYLDYWIENGRGNLDEALDIAKNLEESDLILYAMTQKMEQVRKDTKMSGTKKEEIISKLETDYQKYKEKRDKSIDAAEQEAAGQEGQ